MTDSRDGQLRQRSSAGALGALVRSEARTDPTDPEVPDAKRRRAKRRRQSMVFAAVAVVSLAMIALALLVRMGRQVVDAEAETRRSDRTPPPAPSGESQPPVAAFQPLASSAPAPRAPMQSSAAAASSPAYHAKPPAAPEIIHNPSF
jgi:hypothetical protein